MAALPVQMRTLTMAGVIRDVIKDEKIIGLWRGILPSVTRTVPGVGIYFGSLHWLKTNTIQSTGKYFIYKKKMLTPSHTYNLLQLVPRI